MDEEYFNKDSLKYFTMYYFLIKDTSINIDNLITKFDEYSNNKGLDIILSNKQKEALYYYYIQKKSSVEFELINTKNHNVIEQNLFKADLEIKFLKESVAHWKEVVSKLERLEEIE